ncbi:MAG: PIN domain-containing protein [Variovorax sp.]|nr:MAG: PIN domain-containing protein [Variovorax sp.]
MPAVPLRHGGGIGARAELKLSGVEAAKTAEVLSPAVVIDTNVVLDLLVFDDPCWSALRAALDAGALHWIATPPMRVELARVLGYPMVARRLVRDARAPDAVLALFDARTHTVADVPARAPFVCKDPDDQMFIDLAVAFRARLLSKDRLVLALRRRLATLGVVVAPVFAG